MSQICEYNQIQLAEQQAADEFARLHDANSFTIHNLGPSLTEEIDENSNSNQVHTSHELEYEC